MKHLGTFLSEGITYGIGDHVKLSNDAHQMHGQQYGQVSAIGGFGALKGHVEVTLKKSPLHTNDYGSKVPVPMKHLTNLTKNPAQHQVEIDNHTYKASGLRRGSTVKLKGGKTGKVEAHNLVNGHTQVKHEDGTTSHHRPSDYANLNKKEKK